MNQCISRTGWACTAFVFTLQLAAACSEAAPAVLPPSDAGTPPACDAATLQLDSCSLQPRDAAIQSRGSAQDAALSSDANAKGCPSVDPTPGTACSGALRCQLARHGDCLAPTCPAGCSFLGIDPNAHITSGVTFFATCTDGRWTQSSQGDCSANRDAALCDCQDSDAGD